MFPSPLLVVLATLVLFIQAAKIENMNDFKYIIHFENSTDPSSKIEPFRPNGKLNETIDGGNYKINSTSETNNKSILKIFTGGISDYLNSYFNSSCETSNIFPAEGEACLCMNSTVLFFFKRNNCYLVKVNGSDIKKNIHDSH